MKSKTPNISETSLASARQGDFDGFARFFLAQSNTIKFQAYTIVGCNEIARDIVSQTYIKACDNIQNYSHDFHMTTWLSKIARNLALDHVNSKAVRTTERMGDRPVGLNIEDDTSIQTNAYEAEAIRETLVKIIGLLNETHAKMLSMRYFDGMKHEDIAKELNIPVCTVRGQVRRTLAKLKKNKELQNIYASL